MHFSLKFSFCQNLRKMRKTISASVWRAQLPAAGRKIHHLWFKQVKIVSVLFGIICDPKVQIIDTQTTYSPYQVLYVKKGILNESILQNVYFDDFSLLPGPFLAKLQPHGHTVEIKSSLVFYPHRSRSRKNEYMNLNILIITFFIFQSYQLFWTLTRCFGSFIRTCGCGGCQRRVKI